MQFIIPLDKKIAFLFAYVKNYLYLCTRKGFYNRRRLPTLNRRTYW